MADKRERVKLQIIQETDDQFQLIDIEAEEPTESATIKPYDPELIRVDPKTFSLRQILDMIDDGDLELAPDFQRLKVWNNAQKSRLIESVLLRIPLPAFYFSSDEYGGLQVVDGLQRLSTIHDFVRGGSNGDRHFKLTGLEYLQDQIGNKTIHEIQPGIWNRRINITQITVNVIDPQTPRSVKFDIFKRLNTGGSPLTAQEIRHCLSKSQSREFLMALTNDASFQAATQGRLRNNLRMADREIVLRFCAFAKFPGLKNYSKYDSMDDFLNSATQLIDAASTEELESLRNGFTRAMENSIIIFERYAFRKWQIDDNRLWPINRALFEVWSVVLSRYDNLAIHEKWLDIQVLARNEMSYNDDFISSISTGTSDINKVHERFSTVNFILASVIA